MAFRADLSRSALLVATTAVVRIVDGVDAEITAQRRASHAFHATLTQGADLLVGTLFSAFAAVVPVAVEVGATVVAGHFVWSAGSGVALATASLDPSCPGATSGRHRCDQGDGGEQCDGCPHERRSDQHVSKYTRARGRLSPGSGTGRPCDLVSERPWLWRGTSSGAGFEHTMCDARRSAHGREPFELAAA